MRQERSFTTDLLEARPAELCDSLDGISNIFDAVSYLDWHTFLREYRLSTLKDKFEAKNIRHPLKQLRSLLPWDDRRKTINDDGGYDAFCEELGLTIAEKIAPKSAMEDFIEHQENQKKDHNKKHRSFLNLYAIHILVADAVSEAKTDVETVTFNIALIGASDAGKTAIVERLVNNRFYPVTPKTVGMDMHVLNVDVDPEHKKYPIANVRLWDTGGHEKFGSSVTAQYYRGKDAFIFVYDVSDEESFNTIQHWHNDMEKVVDKDDVVRVLVGNKTDLLFDKTKFTTGDANEIRKKAKELAESLEMPLFQISCKSGHNIVTMTVETLKNMFESRSIKTKKSTRVNLEETRETPVRKKGCCK